GVHTLEINFTDEASILAAAAAFGDNKLDVLVNCGGKVILNSHPVSQTRLAILHKPLISTQGPFLSSKAFLPSLSKAPLGKIISISSNMAGVERLNQLTKTMAINLQKLHLSHVVTLAVHPGWLPTRLAGFHGADDMETCMAGLV
ncbi:hypothetical protein B0T17DRAFT_463145, partial [Bombardia bombarda]